MLDKEAIRLIILSNGNLHCFQDVECCGPYTITSFPKPVSVTGYQKVTPNSQRLIEKHVGKNDIIHSRQPKYHGEAGWKDETGRVCDIKDYVSLNQFAA